jgi:hypothetical protein
MEETLTVISLGVPEELRKTLSTNNPIELSLSETRTRTGWAQCASPLNWNAEMTGPRD